MLIPKTYALSSRILVYVGQCRLTRNKNWTNCGDAIKWERSTSCWALLSAGGWIKDIMHPNKLSNLVGIQVWGIWTWSCTDHMLFSSGFDDYNSLGDL